MRILLVALVIVASCMLRAQAVVTSPAVAKKGAPHTALVRCSDTQLLHAGDNLKSKCLPCYVYTCGSYNKFSLTPGAEGSVDASGCSYKHAQPCKEQVVAFGAYHAKGHQGRHKNSQPLTFKR